MHESFYLSGCTLSLAGCNEVTHDLLVEVEHLVLSTKFRSDRGAADGVSHGVLAQQENYTSTVIE